jgi:hypothetical protein
VVRCVVSHDDGDDDDAWSSSGMDGWIESNRMWSMRQGNDVNGNG